ncbi:hypothetical protein GGR42_001961 [Saonia flava]|uniref:Lipoprotein n=1 Tax=Saonia flava TaxID=523696 RepID=A0A846R3V6_9FLAO|nr:hypothetical protein [Saonia flava]NJB71499.1 hypothetical protein [Saonia flava]
MDRIEKIKFEIKVYRCFFSFILIILVGCKRESKIYKIDKRSNLGISLIEHPYVFEGEDYEVNSFFVHKDLNTNEYVLNLSLMGNVSQFSKNHRAFIHGFKNWSDSDKKINLVMNNPKTKGDSVVFCKTLTLKKDSLFERMNFGVEDKITKQRIFVLTLKNVDLHEFIH